MSSPRTSGMVTVPAVGTSLNDRTSGEASQARDVMQASGSVGFTCGASQLPLTIPPPASIGEPTRATVCLSVPREDTIERELEPQSVGSSVVVLALKRPDEVVLPVWPSVSSSHVTAKGIVMAEDSRVKRGRGYDFERAALLARYAARGAP